MSRKDDARCKRCVHHGNISGFVTCEYILNMQEPRPCKAGVECTVFEAMNKKREKKSITISHRRHDEIEADIFRQEQIVNTIKTGARRTRRKTGASG